MIKDRYKFRLWDNREKRYYRNVYDLAAVTAQGYVTLIDTFERENRLDSYRDSDRFTVEQCTGIKDITGKLIFEGDVIRFTRSLSMEPLKVDWSDRLARYVLRRINDGAEADGVIAPMVFGIESYEVVGNIHGVEA